MKHPFYPHFFLSPAVIRAACDNAVSLPPLSRQRKQRGVAKISPGKSITRRSMPML
jgi:hypothetical protein